MWKNGLEKRLSFIDKEKNEESGDHNFGVRQYDDVSGRFMAIDPLWEKYRSLSPYNYCGNNPLGLIDPSGMAADVTIDGGSLTASMHMVFYSNSISDRSQVETLAQESILQIKKQWDGKSATIGTQDYTLNLSLTYEVVDATQAAEMSANNSSNAVNFIGVETGSGSSARDNQGIFKTEEILNSKTTISHEFGHLLGINIHSEDLIGKSIGFQRGVWDIMLGNNFGEIGGSMAKGYDPELRTVTATNIKQFFYINALSNKVNRPTPGPNIVPIGSTKKTLGTN